MLVCDAAPWQDVNTVEAIWMKSPSEVDEAKYNEFYKFIAKAFDEPLAKVGGERISEYKCKTPIDTWLFLCVYGTDVSRTRKTSNAFIFFVCVPFRGEEWIGGFVHTSQCTTASLSRCRKGRSVAYDRSLVASSTLDRDGPRGGSLGHMK